MKITTPIASAAVREVINKQANDKKNKFSAQQKKTMKKCKVMFANSHLLEGENEFIGWWAAGVKPETTKDILFSELVGLAGGWASGILGGIVDTRTVGKVLGVISDIHSGVETASGTVSQDVYNRLSGAWKAGTYTSAIGTPNEFILFAEGMLFGGPIHMTIGKDAETINVSTKSYNGHDDFFSWMEIAEKADGKSGTVKTKEYAEAGSWKLILPLTP